MTKHKLTSKQHAILHLLYHYRFLSRNHIQLLLNHKDHHRINSWLKDLTEQGYIHRIFEQTTFRGRMTASLYSLTSKGARTLKTLPKCNPHTLKRITRKKDYSPEFIDSYLLVADLYLHLNQVKQEDSTLHLRTQNDLANHTFLPKPLPNAYIAYLRPHKRTKRYFVEVLDTKMPRFVIRRRIQRYFDFAESGEWKQQTKHPFPKIMIICANEKIENYVHKRVLIAQAESYEDIVFFTTTNTRLRHPNESQGLWQEMVEED